MKREKIIFIVGITFCFIGFGFASANIDAAWFFGGISFITIAYYIFDEKTVSK